MVRKVFHHTIIWDLIWIYLNLLPVCVRVQYVVIVMEINWLLKTIKCNIINAHQIEIVAASLWICDHDS